MQVISLIMGILAMMGAFVAFLPLLGWMNWGVIPFAVVGLVIGIIAAATARRDRGIGIAGTALCAIAIVIGTVRLIIGFGVI
jgi:type III secretory pathway component EscS